MSSHHAMHTALFGLLTYILHCSCSQYGGPTLFLSITIAPCSKITSEETCKLRSEVPRHTSSLLVATLIARLLVTVHRLSVLQPIRYTLPTEYIPNYRQLAYTIGRDPLQTLLVMAAAVRYAATAGPHRVRRNALSRMVGAAQNLDSPTPAHLHARRMLFAYWP